jgi:hypothetical protein
MTNADTVSLATTDDGLRVDGVVVPAAHDRLAVDQHAVDTQAVVGGRADAEPRDAGLERRPHARDAVDGLRSGVMRDPLGVDERQVALGQDHHLLAAGAVDREHLRGIGGSGCGGRGGIGHAPILAVGGAPAKSAAAARAGRRAGFPAARRGRTVGP